MYTVERTRQVQETIAIDNNHSEYVRRCERIRFYVHEYLLYM